MAMKPKKVSSSAKKPVKRMRGGGMVAMKEPVAMKKGGAVAGAAAGAAAGAMTLKSIQSSMRSLAKELGVLGAGAKASKAKSKGRGPK